MKEKWNAWDVPYYVAKAPTHAAPIVAEQEPAAPEPPTPQPATGPVPVAVLKLADGGARISERIMAILIGFGAILGGFVVAGAFLFLGFILSFGSSPDGGAVAFAIALGGLVAVGGLIIAGLMYYQAGRPQQILVGSDAIEISYRTFGHPLRVPRDLVRVATLDQQPMKPFRNNPRFPIHGALPDDIFADALDNVGKMPWDDLDPERFKRRRIPIGGAWQRLNKPRGYTHDEPVRDGWASGGALQPSLPPAPKDAYLWSKDGSSLPFLRIGPADVPNLAIIFRETIRTPRPRWWWYVLPMNNCAPGFHGGRAVRGMLFRVENSVAAEVALERWDVVRPVTAEDVLGEGLLVAKPLVGKRAIVYGAIMAASLLMQLLARSLR